MLAHSLGKAGPSRESAPEADLSKPLLGRLLKHLGLHVTAVKAQGMRIFPLEGKPRPVLLDFLGGYGSLMLGHNHPAIKQAAVDFLDSDLPVHAQLMARPGSIRLAALLNKVLRHDGDAGGNQGPYTAVFTNSGTETVEAALKHALLSWRMRREALQLKLRSRLAQLAAEESCLGDAVGSEVEGQALRQALVRLEQARPRILAVEHGFHGKSPGALAVTANQDYRKMYTQAPFLSAFLHSGLTEAEMLAAMHPVAMPMPAAFSETAAVIFEPIQGEGGIHELPAQFLHRIQSCARSLKVPVIADEIQTGMFRTGKFLASLAVGLSPDYILLGKSLGGGVAKIGAALIHSRLYCREFDLLHSSTFADDGLSSAVAERCLSLLSERSGEIAVAAGRFQEHLLGTAALIRHRFPGVLHEARGRGLLMGLEFDCRDALSRSRYLHVLRESGYFGYLLAGFLLHEHGVRVGPTLSHPMVLRLTPPAQVGLPECEVLRAALLDLAESLHSGRLERLVRHLGN